MGTEGAATLAALQAALLGVAAEREVEPVLRRLVEAARHLVGARYAAIGVPDPDGDGFARFLHVGMSEELVAELGPLPRTHGLLGAMLAETEPSRSDDIGADPRFEWWPAAHPRMRAFLGVPVLAAGEVVGAFYLTDKPGGFTDADQRTIELLAAHAAIAIEQASLSERARELSIAQERTRLAHELHDALTQQLFSLSLLAEAAAATLTVDAEATAASLATIRGLAGTALDELRALVADLRPPTVAADGLAAAVAKHVAVSQRAHGRDVELTVRGEGQLPPATERVVFRVLQESLANALRHASADHVRVLLDLRGPVVRAEVVDDGRGFDPDAPPVAGHHLGLASMRDRARAAGGTLAVRSAPGAGTTVRLEVPLP